jgi:hypothetical protein
MTDRPHEPTQPADTDPFMATIVSLLMALLWVVLARAAGLGWKGVLHWTGEALLIIGILLAAQGISDVRREWTRRPGFWGSIEQKGRTIRVRVSVRLWAARNWIAARRWLAWLRLRPHVRMPVTMSSTLNLGFSATGELQTGWGPPPGDGTVEERLAWLENHMTDAGRQLGDLNTWRKQEVRDRQAAAEAEKAARMAEDHQIRDSMADFAGGGLRLQAWGVVCLLAGTLITAIW